MPAILRHPRAFGLALPDTPLEVAVAATLSAFGRDLRPLALEVDVGMLDLDLHAVVDESMTRTALATDPLIPAQVRVEPVGRVTRRDAPTLDDAGLAAWLETVRSEPVAPAGHRAVLTRAELLASALTWTTDAPLALEPVTSCPAPRLTVDALDYVAGPLAAQFAWRKPPVAISWAKPSDVVELEILVHWSPWADPPTLVHAAIERLQAQGARLMRGPG